MIRKLNQILGKQVHPGKLKHPTYRLFTLRLPRGTGITGARPIFRARQQVEDVLLKVAKTRIDKPRLEKGIFRIKPPARLCLSKGKQNRTPLLRAGSLANLLATW